MTKALKPAPEAVSTVRNLTAPERDARNLILASTARKWESEVNDLRNLARVLLTVLDGTLTAAKDPDHEDTYLITSDDIDQIYFCAYQSQRMSEAFYETYYAALKA